MNSQSKKQLEEFGEWFLLRFLVPSLPFVIEAIIKSIWGSAYQFPNGSTLILAFLFPLFTMMETKGKLLLTCLVIASGAGLVLFTLAVVADAQGDIARLHYIYRYGLFLFVGVAGLHLLPKLYGLVRVVFFSRVPG